MDEPTTKRDLYFLYFLLFAGITTVPWICFLSIVLAVIVKWGKKT